MSLLHIFHRRLHFDFCDSTVFAFEIWHNYSLKMVIFRKPNQNTKFFEFGMKNNHIKQIRFAIIAMTLYFLFAIVEKKFSNFFVAWIFVNISLKETGGDSFLENWYLNITCITPRFTPELLRWAEHLLPPSWYMLLPIKIYDFIIYVIHLSIMSMWHI